jgi:hypothetical protein
MSMPSTRRDLDGDDDDGDAANDRRVVASAVGFCS